MEFDTNNTEGNGARYNVAETRLRTGRSPGHTAQGRPTRRAARQALRMVKKIGTGRIERQKRKRLPRQHLQRALTGVLSVATMLSFVSFPKSLGSLDHKLPKRILSPEQCQLDAVDDLVAPHYRSSSPVLSKRPRRREEPCPFRTKLMDDIDGESETAFNSTDKLNIEDVKFDDTQCVSVGRSPEKFRAGQGIAAFQSQERSYHDESGNSKQLSPHLYAIPVDEKNEPSQTQHSNVGFVLVGQNQDGNLIHKSYSDPTPSQPNPLEDDGDNENDMEPMNMPFWYLPKRQKRHSHHSRTNLPDDISIISDISLIPTYFPSDVMKQQQQQQQQSRHRALIKRLIVAKARSARQTMRQLKRSCRDAVGHAFAEPAKTYRPTPCVPVGLA